MVYSVICFERFGPFKNTFSVTYSSEKHTVVWILHIILKSDSHSNADNFFNLSCGLQHFHSDSTPQFSDKTLMQSIFRWPIQCVMSVKRSWCWTSFNSRSGITHGMFWYQSIGLTPMASITKCTCKRAMKNSLAFAYESNFTLYFVWLQDLRNSCLTAIFLYTWFGETGIVS